MFPWCFESETHKLHTLSDDILLLRNGTNVSMARNHSIINFSRVSGLVSGGEERVRQLAGVARDGGAGAAQGFLAGSVETPWERAVTPANVPYYIKSVKSLIS